MKENHVCNILENITDQIDMIINRALFLILIVIQFSCNNKSIFKANSPLVSIVSLNSAEALEDFNEAKKYQDVDLLYGQYAKESSITAEKYWMNFVKENNKLASDRKFTNQFKYYNYNIKEMINGSKSQVTFRNKNKSDRIQTIVYHLSLRNSIWKVIKVEYQISETYDKAY